MESGSARGDGRPFGTLARREQIARLRRLAEAALDRYDLAGPRLTLVQHEHNTTFRVQASGDEYVLRVNRPGVHTPATIASEMGWLAALRRDTDLAVPEPVAARNGAAAVLAHAAGMPGPRVCVVLRWLPGRFVDERLAPEHLRDVARLQAGLQAHAAGWGRPDGFARPRVDTLTATAKAASVAPGVVVAPPWAPGEHPTREDADRGLALVTELFAVGDAAVVAAALDVVWATTRALATDPSAAGLVHGDLHQANYLFERGAVRAIDFDDCGWGFHLYDLAVTLSEVGGRERSDALRAAFLEEHAARGTLPDGAEAHVDALILLRRIQLLVWVLESREHAAFRERWQPWARDLLDGIAAALDAVR